MTRLLILLLAVMGAAYAQQAPPPPQLHNPALHHHDRRAVGGGRTVITTITTIAEMKPLEEHEGLEISKYLDDNDITLLQSSWENLKHCPDFAPKVFIRYFKAKPEAQKLFPAFANVPISELENNKHFLLQAYTCITSLNYVMPHLKDSHAAQCTAFKNLKNRYHKQDLKRFGEIFVNTMEEELGNKFKPDIRKAWEKGINCFNDYASRD